jgi:hypothetical protein
LPAGNVNERFALVLLFNRPQQRFGFSRRFLLPERPNVTRIAPRADVRFLARFETHFAVQALPPLFFFPAFVRMMQSQTNSSKKVSRKSDNY